MKQSFEEAFSKRGIAIQTGYSTVQFDGHHDECCKQQRLSPMR